MLKSSIQNFKALKNMMKPTSLEWKKWNKNDWCWRGSARNLLKFCLYIPLLFNVTRNQIHSEVHISYYRFELLKNCPGAGLHSKRDTYNSIRSNREVHIYDDTSIETFAWYASKRIKWYKIIRNARTHLKLWAKTRYRKWLDHVNVFLFRYVYVFAWW